MTAIRQFEDIAQDDPVDWNAKPTGSRPDLGRLLAVCRRLLDGGQVSLITMDMPLSLEPISRRRTADDAVSRAFGTKGCAVHSPSAERPGRLADEVRARAAALGFPLATASDLAGTCPALIEVYPHPALVRLLRSDFHIRYNDSPVIFNIDQTRISVQTNTRTYKGVFRKLELRFDQCAGKP